MRGRGLILATVAAAALGAFACSAQAAVTIGSNLAAPPADNMPGCGVAGFPCTATNLSLPASSLAAGGLTSPVNGTVTSWMASANMGNNISLQVLRQVSGSTYTGVSTSAPQSWPGPGISPAFPTSLPIQQGDAIGLQSPQANLIFANTPAASIAVWSLAPNGPLANGSTRAADFTMNGKEVLVQATIEPTSITGGGGGVGTAATFGAITRNKKKGTATVTVHLPNPGTLAYSGSGIKASGPASIGKAGDVQVNVKAVGKKRKKLNSKGKVGVSLTVTFTPTGGTPGSASTSFKLIKKR